MQVAIPSAIAFGITIHSPLGVEHVAQGALAGALDARRSGRTRRHWAALITATCEPATTALAAFAV